MLSLDAFVFCDSTLDEELHVLNAHGSQLRCKGGCY